MNVKSDFPIFTAHPDLVYLDSAATSQKPQPVIDAVTDFYTQANANIHRGIYDLSQQATKAFEDVRQKTARFIGAAEPSEIIFAANATEAINYVAYGWTRKNLKRGDIIVTSVMEHHSNFVPWLKLKEELGIELVTLPIDQEYRLDYKIDLDFSRVKLIALTHASNVLGTINPIADILAYFKQRGASAKLLVDAAQTAPHIPVDVKKLGADFLVFSAHKMLGPTGVGVLYAKKDLLDAMAPLITGSHMIESVTSDQATWAQAPDKFEPGTRNIEGVIGLGAAIDYLTGTDMSKIEAHERNLTAYALEQFSARGVKLFGPRGSKERLGVFSFAIDNIHPHDVAEILNRSGVAVRAGHHCAQPLMQALKVTGTTRASTYLYSTREDIDKLMNGIDEVKKVFNVR